MTRGSTPTAPVGGPGKQVGGQVARPMVAVPRGTVMAAAVILVLTQLMLVVDTSIVNVALPDIGRALGFSSAGLSWVVTAYALSFGGLILLSGRVGSLIGPRRVLLIGVSVFVVASVAGGLASTAADLVTARAVQGVGAALAAPSVMVLLMGVTTPGPQRSRVLSMFVLAIGSGAAVGLLTGGVLTQTLGTAAFGDAFEAAGKVVALRRLADAEEIAGAVTFLASQAASYVNGTTLGAMGGMPALG